MTAETEIATYISSLARSGQIIMPFNKHSLPGRWSDSNKNIAFIDLNNYQAISEHSLADQTITLQCGIKMPLLEQFLSQHKQYFPAAYLNKETSLLDLLMTNDAGPLEIIAGGIRRHLLGLTCILSSGEIINTGGRVVKNVSGYDLTRFILGSYGYFALPIKVSLRLCSLPEEKATIIISSNNILELISVSKSILKSGINVAYLDLLNNRLLSNSQLSIAISEEPKNLADARYSLFVQLCAESAILADCINYLKDLLNKNDTHFDLITDAFKQQDCSTFLTKTTAILQENNSDKKEKRIVQVAASNSVFLNLAQNTSLNPFNFVYRPGIDKMIYCLSDIQEQNSLLDCLSIYAKNRQRLTVAYGSENYIWQVKELGNTVFDNQTPIQIIKERLKKQFDPQNAFNPFVDI